MSKRIGYIVMPPGHGKSVLHNPEIKLYEADRIVYWKEDESLREAREHGWETGNWDCYDYLWASKMKSLIPEDSIVMVPVHSVGEALGAERIGALYLDWEQWTDNFKNRKGSPSKYTRCWEDAKVGGVSVKTNEQTTHQVRRWHEKWMQERKGVRNEQTESK